MKVIHCLNHFLPQQVAGTEVYVWALCKALQNLGCDSSVLIPNYNSPRSAEYEYDYIRVHQYAEPSVIDRSLITGQRVPDGLKSFSNYIKEQRPDIVHFHEIAGSNGVSVNHFEVAKATGAKVIFTMHLATNSCRTGTLMYEGKTICNGKIDAMRCGYCSLLHQTGNRQKARFLISASKPFYEMGVNTINWQNKLGTALSFPFQIETLRTQLHRIADACDKIIPITAWYSKLLLQEGVPQKKLQVILQALPNPFSGILSPTLKTSRPVKLIFIGRIDELKGISLLLEVIQSFSADEVQLDLYGKAPDPVFFEACKAKTKANSNIRWMGNLSQDKVVATVSTYHALVLPSMFSEMSPLVIQEAFAAGTPVIGSNVYGIAEQIKDGVNGMLFDFGSKDSLKSVIRMFIDDKSLREKISNHRTKPRSFAEVGRETFEVYKSVLERKEVAAI
jgi:glycosyltransferase involved in cell wall biosynthesis